eukprot:g11001.t1
MLLRLILLLLLPVTAVIMSIIPASVSLHVRCSPADRRAAGPGRGGVARSFPSVEKSPLAARNNDASSVEGAAPNGGSGGGTSTCRNCKKQFRRDENEDGACSYHPGFFSGRLNRVNDVDTSGLEYFWSCCGQPDKDHPGCTTGRHVSYDDPEDGGLRSPLTGMKLR